MKYHRFLEILEDDRIYSPGTITQNGKRNGLFPEGLSDQELRHAQLRVRISLGRFAYNHNFPREGDGLVTVLGQPTIAGWKGSRWKAAMGK